MIIALEEHFFDPAWNESRDSKRHAARADSPLVRTLEDLAEGRLRAMDEGGIDMQVISHAPPGAQGVAEAQALAWSRASNDRLHAAVKAHPDRFAGLASVPIGDAAAGADELERCVASFGFKGAVLHTIAEGPPLDHQRFWPIFARAEKLDVPVYIHPSDPGGAIRSSHYAGFDETHPMFIRAGWGFMVEAGTQAMRLVLSGLFDVCPKLNLILGHLGETIPYQLARIDESLSRDTPMKNFREVFTRHFYVTTSGFFSTPALRCCIEEMGADRVMFSVDWPYASNTTGATWLREAEIDDADRSKIMSQNAIRLLKL